MKKTVIIIVVVLFVIASAAVAGYFGLRSKTSKENEWKEQGFDLSVPQLGDDGWYMVFEDDFNGSSLNEDITFGEKYSGTHNIWTTSPNAIRWKSDNESKSEQACWWCDDMVEVRDGNLVVHSKFESNHSCSGSCPESARFTGGIETRKITGDSNNNKGTQDELLFSQAFGYYEVKAKLPYAKGLWSAFWLQSSNQRKISSEGVDGTEIDVFESAFINSSTSKMGHALLWNGYGKYGKCSGKINRLEQDLYDGYHTYALKWTPEYYVFYIDGEPTWATMDGGVSKVKEFLRLTVEIDAGDGWGPHSQRIGQFDDTGESEFCVDYIKVWQNEGYEQYIIDDDLFPGSLDFSN